MGRSTAIGLLAAVALVVAGGVWWIAGSATQPDPGPGLTTVPLTPRGAEAAPGFKGAVDAAGPAAHTLQPASLVAAAGGDGLAGLAAPAAPSAAHSAPPVSIIGRVLDDSGRSVEGARISFAANRLMGGLVLGAAAQAGSTPPPDPEAVTGRDGRFRLEVEWQQPGDAAEPMPELLRLDRKQLAVRHEAFATLVTELVHPGGEQLDLGDLYVQPGCWIAGRIVDPNGRPLAEATVSATERRAPSGGMRAGGRSGPSIFGVSLAESLGAVKTGADGRFRLTGLAAGEADVSARLSGRRVGHAAVLDLVERGGRDVGDIVLEPGSSIAGRVLDERGRPIEGARLSVSSMARLVVSRIDDLPRQQLGQEFAQRSFTDANGFFEIGGLGSGHYTVNVEAEGFEAFSKADVAAGTRNLDLNLSPLGALLVRVVSNDGERPLAKSRLTVDRPVRGPRFMQLLAGRPPLEGAEALAAAGLEGDPAGVFLVQDVGPDGVTLVAGAEGHATLSVAAPGVAPRKLEEFTITLTPESVVAGIVLDREGEPLSGARVELSRPAPGADGGFRAGRNRVEFSRSIVLGGAEPDAEALSAERTETRTAADGSFELRGVAAGEWELTARAEGHVRSAAQRLALQEGESRRDLQLQLQPAGRVLGSVVEADGLLVADIEVVAEPVVAAQTDSAAQPRAARFGRMLFGAPEGTHRTRTDAEGNYSLEGLPPGPYSISLRANSGEPRAFGGGALVLALGGGSGTSSGPSLAVDVQPGVDVRADFVRPRRGLLGGRVLAAGGKPLPEARVSLRPRRDPADEFAALAQIMGGGESVQSDAFGGYRFEEVEAGDYEVVAFAPGAALEKSVPVSLGAGEQRSLDIALGGAALSGRVVREGSEEGVGGVTVTIVPEREAGAAPAPRALMSVMTTTGGGAGGMSIDLGGPSSAIRTAPDGSFEIAHLDPGSYRIETSGGGFASGEAGPFDLAEGQHRSGVLVEVLKGAVVSGRLISATGQDLDGVPVRLSGEGRREMSVSNAGRFRFEGLAAGSYEVEALGSGFGGEALAAESLQLQSGEERSLELRTKG